ncbi:hypothetical protein LCGC14_2354070, partial [marine sediment metagenome]
IESGGIKTLYIKPSEDSGGGPDIVNEALLYYVTMKGDLGKAMELMQPKVLPSAD